MKPGDHPDFFRLPPPPGASRESTIVLDASGRFWHDGAPVEHAGLARGFASWIGRHPDDGRFILHNGYDWCYFRVEDAPYFVTGVRAIDGGLELTLFDGSSEPLDPTQLRVDDEGVLRTRVKGGEEARFARAGQLALAPFLADGPALRIGERTFAIAPA